ncbi:MAG: DNA polymerase III subunit delta [Actinomycetota bacterium]|nr:DNA polymerase III subunit delta [Actinomycetota bacterium]
MTGRALGEEGEGTPRAAGTSRAGPAGTSRAGSPGTVHVVRGDDPALVVQAARALVERLSGGVDQSLAVEEHGAADELDVGAIVDACTTPPLLADRRVVVVREAGRLGASDAARLAQALDHAVPSVHLVLVAGGGSIPAPLVKLAAASGEVVEAAAGRGRERGRWMAEQLRHAPVRLDAAASRRLEEHLGEDLGRLAGLLESLAAAYGKGASVSLAALEPFLGEAGAVPPWELTDAVDQGDARAALRALHRLVGSGRPAPLVLATLHSHFSNMLRLDGAAVVTADAAAALLGVKSPFVAKKALERARQLGSERIGQAVTLIADADLDVKGRTALPAEVVLEVLVARLARLARTRAAAPHAQRSAPAPRGGRARR